jgi:large subunit ribosomal protein L10
MPLTKDQKQEQVAAIAEQLEGHHTVYLTDYIGLTVDEVTRLRRAFRDADIEFRVYKNTLLRRAMEAKGGFDELYEQLNGPTAVAFTNDPAGPAKVIKKFLEGRDKALPKFKGAYVDGAVFGEGQLDALASFKSRDELLADILGLLMAPITNVASALGAPGRKLAGAVKEIAERAEA